MEQDTYNMEQLAQRFSLDINPGNLKKAMKANGATSNDLWKFPVQNLRPIVGFNVRVRNAKYFARVRRYADSMKKEGYWAHKPMAGYIGRDRETDEEFFFMTAGYTRRDAIDLANSELPEDKQIEFVTVVAHPAQTTTLQQLNALLITENDAASLDPYEAAIVCKRMLDDGCSVERIAVDTRFSEEWVKSLLQLAAAPIELQAMVVDDVITSTFAIETIKEHGGEEALAIMKAALARKTGGAAQPTPEPAPAADPDSPDVENEAAPAPKKRFA
jgi:hypothetical protein